MRLRAVVLAGLASFALALASYGASSAVDAELQAGDTSVAAGDAAGGITHYAKARALALRDGDRASEIDASLREASVYRSLGDTTHAEERVSYAEGRAAGLPEREADVRIAKGMLALDVGDARESERLFQVAFDSYRDLGVPHGAANAAVDLGLARLAQGRDAEALRAFDAAGTLFQALGDDKGRADALVNGAIALRRSGRLADARARLTDAVAIYRAGSDVVGELDAIGNLALVAQDLGDFDGARTLYEGALAGARQRKDAGRQAVLLQNLGTLEHRAGNAELAVSHYASAEELYADLGRATDALSVRIDALALTGASPEAWASVVTRAKGVGDVRLLATAELDRAAALRGVDPDRALKSATTARDLADRVELRGVRWRSRYVIGLVQGDLGRHAVAIESLMEAVEILDQSRAGLDTSSSQEFVASHLDTYRALVDALVSAGRADEAVIVAEQLRTHALPDSLPDDDPLVARYKALDDQTRWVEEQVGGAQGGRQESLREQLAALRVEFARTVDELRVAHPEFDELVRVEPEDLEAVQDDLDPGVVVLEPVLFDDRLVLLVFKREGTVARSVTVDARALQATIDTVVTDLRGGDIYDAAAMRTSFDRLGEWLLAPIVADLVGADTLVIAADGPFREVPFGALRRDGHWLVEDLAVAYVTHVGSLDRRGSAEPAFRLDGPALLLLGNPDGSLPGAEAEVTAIASKFPGAETLIGPAATRSALLSESLDKRAIHLATHGTLDPDEPDRSWLTLAGPGSADHLTYREIPGLAPYLTRCRLVVLSACESAVPLQARAGRVQVSIDGLAAQFRRAGVETLVASLWRVDDAGTQALMEQFYGNLGRGQNVAQALRHAQLSMLRGDLAHPWYWAGFVVVGDWR